MAVDAIMCCTKTGNRHMSIYGSSNCDILIKLLSIITPDTVIHLNVKQLGERFCETDMRIETENDKTAKQATVFKALTIFISHLFSA